MIILHRIEMRAISIEVGRVELNICVYTGRYDDYLYRDAMLILNQIKEQ